MWILRHCANCGREEANYQSDKCDRCGGRMTNNETENLKDKTVKRIKMIRLRRLV